MMREQPPFFSKKRKNKCPVTLSSSNRANFAVLFVRGETARDCAPYSLRQTQGYKTLTHTGPRGVMTCLCGRGRRGSGRRALRANSQQCGGSDPR